MLDTTVYPTHTCFDDAAAYIRERAEGEPEICLRDDFLLVHAIINPPTDNPVGRHAHAWVEEVIDGEPMAIWSGILHGEKVFLATPRAQYEAQAGIEAVTKYTMREVWIENEKAGHVGPWREEYLALCRDRSAA